MKKFKETVLQVRLKTQNPLIALIFHRTLFISVIPFIVPCYRSTYISLYTSIATIIEFYFFITSLSFSLNLVIVDI